MNTVRPCRTTGLRWILLLCVAAATPTAHPAERIDPDAARDKIEQLAVAALDQGAVGLSIAVSYDNEVILAKGYGLAEVEHDVATDAESIFRIGSITKQFTAALVMKLVENGKIGLDTNINEYTDFPTGDHTVTIRHLLTHTSGIKSYTGLGEEWEKTRPLETTHEEVLGLVDELPFDFAPGEQFKYNNTGYYLLGVILEMVTGKSYDQLLLDEIIEPLGLTRTRYGSNADIIKNRAQGYTMSEDELKNDDLIGMSRPGAAGAIVSTAADLLRWQHALSGERVVAAESYEQMTTPFTLNDGSSTTYGFGLSMREIDGLEMVSHGGGINGFNSMLAHYPGTAVAISVISNSEGYRAGVLATKIMRAVHGIVIEISDLPVPPAEQKRLAGEYKFKTLPLELSVRADGEHLVMQATGQGEVRLLRQEEGDYRASFDNDVVVEFAAGDPAPGLTLRQRGGVFEAERIP
jgi:CubicO group peptidase (beta-lactamase class C family)